ncbi:TPA: DNA cytosine methyltransferase, partial [Campylobacter jejuni]|nr:DNA cytosine methyltransferase [Campylobacter jejuni]
MFSSAGIGELDLEKLGIKVVLSNELLPKRAEFYKKIHPNSKMIVGDITDKKVFDEYVSNIPDDVKLLIATPPCQGASTLGVNKQDKDLNADLRNQLIIEVFKIIEQKEIDYILIENVPRYLDILIKYNDIVKPTKEIVYELFSNKYDIKVDIFNAKYFGIPQSRPRAVIRMCKKHLIWNEPKEQREITLKEAIGHLPSLESGETSNLKHHSAKMHNPREILCMKHTPSGQSAFKNDFYYPRKENGDKVKGFHNTYKRMKWDEPAPARTMNSGNIGSH